MPPIGNLFRLNAILYLCAPGAAKLFVPCALSLSVVSSSGVTISSVTWNPTLLDGVVSYLEIYKWISAICTKIPSI